MLSCRILLFFVPLFSLGLVDLNFGTFELLTRKYAQQSYLICIFSSFAGARRRPARLRLAGAAAAAPLGAPPVPGAHVDVARGVRRVRVHTARPHAPGPPVPRVRPARASRLRALGRLAPAAPLPPAVRRLRRHEPEPERGPDARRAGRRRVRGCGPRDARELYGRERRGRRRPWRRVRVRADVGVRAGARRAVRRVHRGGAAAPRLVRRSTVQ